MKNFPQSLISEDIFFITPDIKRAIGIEDLLPNYHMICSHDDPLIPVLRGKGAKIFCLEEISRSDVLSVNNSGSLLSHPLVVDYINSHTHDVPYIMYFKPSVKIDSLIKAKNYRAIGNSFDLNEQFENKIKFFEFCYKYLPEFSISGEIGMLSQLNFEELNKNLGLPLVIQFGHGWAGKTTYFIKTKKEFLELSKKFPKTNVKATRKIDGYTVLNNCCVYRDLVLVSPPAIQLSDIPELYPKSGVTCGRQWPVKFLNREQINQICDISKKVGKMMMRAGYEGFFGLDFLVDDTFARVYLSEINARLTASANFYAYLEKGLGGVPLMVYHIASFLDKDISCKGEISDDVAGSQIIFRQSVSRLPLSSINFGVFELRGEKPILIRQDYSPDKLKKDEFIYIKRYKKDDRVEGEEISRVETKREVLSTVHGLSSWIKNLL